MLKLRNFLYVNSQLLDDYLSAVDGFSYEEEIRSDRNNKVKEGEVTGGIPVISGSGKLSSSSDTEIRRNVKITESVKFQRIYEYLKENDSLKYYETFNEDIWTGIERDEFLEVLVTARFSKIKELADAAKGVANLAAILESFSEQPLLDKKAKDAIGGITGLASLKKGNEVSCVLSFPNTKEYPMLAYLDKQYFRIEQERFVGEFYMLCKVQRKIEKNQKVELDEIFEDLKNLPLSREQRRNMPKDLSNPKEFKDTVKGPATIVIPIAMYR